MVFTVFYDDYRLNILHFHGSVRLGCSILRGADLRSHSLLRNSGFRLPLYECGEVLCLTSSKEIKDKVDVQRL